MVEAIIIYIFLSAFSILISIKLYKKLKILDLPNSRKIHTSATPLSGGFALLMLITFLFVYYCLNFKELTTVSVFFYSSIVSLYLIGLLDDLYHLNEKPGTGSYMKMINQLLCGIHLVSTAEALAFGKHCGLSQEIIFQVKNCRIN